MRLVYTYEVCFFSLFKPKLINLILSNYNLTAKIFTIGLTLLVSVIKAVAFKRRDQGYTPQKIANSSIYFKSFLNLHSTINIAYHVQ